MQCANRPAFMTTVQASCGRMLVSGFSRSKRAPSCRYLRAAHAYHVCELRHHNITTLCLQAPQTISQGLDPWLLGR